jgi:probable selenate reductase FAD-binding subunit
MAKRVREFHRPADIPAALALLRRADSRAAVLMLPPRVADDPFAGVEAAVDLRRLALDGISQDDHRLHVGALTSLQVLSDSAPIRAIANGVLAQAAHLAAASALRNAATVGGAVQQHLGAMHGLTRDGPPEVALALLALEAVVVVRSTPGPGREMRLEDYYSTGGMLARDELLVEIFLPVPAAGTAGALARVARTPGDQAIVAAAAVTTEGAVRLAVAGATARPVRLRALEATLAGQAVTAEQLAGVPAQVEALMAPRGDFRASAEYRRAMAGVLVRRALAAAVEAA